MARKYPLAGLRPTGEVPGRGPGAEHIAIFVNTKAFLDSMKFCWNIDVDMICWIILHPKMHLQHNDPHSLAVCICCGCGSYSMAWITRRRRGPVRKCEELISIITVIGFAGRVCAIFSNLTLWRRDDFQLMGSKPFLREVKNLTLVSKHRISMYLYWISQKI